MSRAVEQHAGHAGDEGFVRADAVQRAAVEIRTDTLDVEKRTVQVIWSTGADVVRYDYWTGERYIESLSMEKAHIRIDRFDGMSLLDGHRSHSMSERLGTIVPGSVRISGGKGYATIQISRKERGEELLRDLKDGMPFSVSVGYSVLAYERTEASEDGLARMHAIDWQPMEISAVPIPADAGAHSRSAPARDGSETVDVPVRDFAQHGGAGMSRTNENTVDREAAATIEGNQTRGQPARTSAPGAEATRISAIRGLGTRAGLSADVVATAIDGGTTIEAFRQVAFDELYQRSQIAEGTGLSQVFEPEGRRGGTETDAAAEAIFARANPSHKLSERARQFAHFSLLDHARAAIGRMGERVNGLSPSETFKRAFHSTSDFPILLAGAAQQSLRAGYAAPEAVILEAVRRVSHRDFRKVNHVDLGNLPPLLKINEHGEYKRGTIAEAREGFAISTYGRIIGVTRQLLINDDLGAFTTLPARFGVQARSLEIDLVVEMLTGNPVLSDGVPVFAESRGNLTDAPLSVSGLSAARLLMRRQRDMSGQLIAVSPKYLIVSPELETNAEQLLARISATEAASANPFSGKLTLLVEPRLEGTEWYLAAAPGLVDGLTIANLEGEEGPMLDTKEGWDVDGMELKVRLDAGAGWIDFRGWVRSTGQPE